MTVLANIHGNIRALEAVRADLSSIRVGGRWTYLYRAVDSDGETIDFMVSPYRDLTAAKHFLRLALSAKGRIRPRVINVDGHPAYARAISELSRAVNLAGAVAVGPHRT